MEVCEIRRRHQISNKSDLPMIYKLIILLRSHKDFKIVCTKSSISYRVTCLCDMALKNMIKMDKYRIIKPGVTAETEIEREIIYKISMINSTPEDIVKILNGEKNKSLAIKGLKSKICKEMEAKNILKISKGALYTKIILQNLDLWNEVFNSAIEECRGTPCLKTKIILLAADYINRMESLLLFCNEKDVLNLTKQLSDFKKDIKENRCTEDEQLVFDFLKILLK